MGLSPENTLASFRLALELGCTWLELDVQLAQEGQREQGGLPASSADASRAASSRLVVIHDKTVDRTTNGTGRVADLTLAELQQLDAGQGERIPTLSEVLALVAGRATINVELKAAGTAVAVSHLLDKYCTEDWHPEQFLISSFDHGELAKAAPHYRRGLLLPDPPEEPTLWHQAEKLQAWSIHLYKDHLSPQLVAAVQARGYKCFTFTINEPEELAQALACQVDGVFTDYPDRVLSQREPSPGATKIGRNFGSPDETT